ncbi:hypothetical protein C2S53_010991 [Perilla frutescens var. hirtella]|uniref:CCHC-type domain-containing protein n=1 Tax=Perilla frutescens var. hirtella TaxID=608512 RepID=A0AAD4P931_PERFH|nr:hypothetical protein C2S53_010991 [Perilla frutescens var. hirtella]
MAELHVVGGMKQLNNHNYTTWETCMESYLQGQDLWEVVGGKETTPPEEAEALRKWKIKAGKAMYALKCIVSENLLEHIRAATTPKEAWDNLATLFSKKNEFKLQLLENELLSLRQGDMPVRDYFNKVRTLCREISELDSSSKISEAKMRRIIIHGLKPEFRAIMTSIQGWSEQPSLVNLENLLADQEALTGQMEEVSFKRDNEALFSHNKKKGFSHLKNEYKGKEENSSKARGIQPNRQKKGPPSKGNKKGNCYVCGKPNHYARDCWHRMNAAEGNIATSNKKENCSSEEEWVVEASTAIVEKAEPRPIEELALAVVPVGKINYEKDWIVDSGCSNHMTGDKEKLQDTKEYRGGQIVVTADNSKLPIAHIGKTLITPRFSPSQVQLQDVYHVPGMKKNLLSVAQMTDTGKYLLFGPKDVKVYQNLKVIGWRCCDPTTNKCYTSRHVVFDEASSWNTQQELEFQGSKEIKDRLEEELVKLPEAQEGDKEIGGAEEPNVGGDSPEIRRPSQIEEIQVPQEEDEESPSPPQLRRTTRQRKPNPSGRMPEEDDDGCVVWLKRWEFCVDFPEECGTSSVIIDGWKDSPEECGTSSSILDDEKGRPLLVYENGDELLMFMVNLNDQLMVYSSAAEELKLLPLFSYPGRSLVFQLISTSMTVRSLLSQSLHSLQFRCTYECVHHEYCNQLLLPSESSGLWVFYLGLLLQALCYEPNVVTFTTLLKGLCLDDKVIEAEQLFSKLLALNLCEPDEVTINTLINGLCKGGYTSRACDLLELLETTSCKPNANAYNALIDGLCKDERVEDALRLLHNMIDNGILPDVGTYSSMIHGLCGVGRCKDVKCLFNEMGNMKKAEDVMEVMIRQNISPDVATYNSLIDGYCSQRQMDKAKEIFHSVVDQGLEPDIITYNSLIKGYCTNGKVDEAWCLFLEVPYKGLQHTAYTYNTMIHGLFREGRFAEGWDLFNHMEDQQIHPDLVTYNILLDGLLMDHHIDKSFSFLRRMEDRGFHPNIITYGTLVKGLCANGRVDAARQIINRLPSKCLHPDVRMYTMVLVSLYQQELVIEAKGLLREMEENGCSPCSVTYNFIIRGLLKRNKLYWAMQFLKEMIISGFVADSSTVSMLLDKAQKQKKDEILVRMIRLVVPENVCSQLHFLI